MTLPRRAQMKREYQQERLMANPILNVTHYEGIAITQPLINYHVSIPYHFPPKI